MTERVSPAGPEPGRDYIVVVGASKTGTTGVYATIKHSLARAGHRYATLFEPGRRDRIDAAFTYPSAEPLLVKTTLDRVPTVLPDPLVFERRVMTVRDPRDVLISALLFRPLTKRALERASDDAIEEFIAAVQRKEEDPGSISVGHLFDLAARLGIGGRPYRGMVENYARQRELMARFDFHVMRYEGFVSGDLAGLSGYLGFENVTPAAEPGETTYGHIVRSKESGQFREWFLPEDLERFNATFADALSAFGYVADVSLSAAPRLDPATGSQHLRDRVGQRRRALGDVAGARDMTADIASSAQVTQLIDPAENGNPWACLRIAEAYRHGRGGVARDDDLALHWARRSARLGLRTGMQLADELLARAGSDDAAAHRERRVWQLASARTDNPGAAQIAALERKIAKLKSSARMRVGTQLVRAASNPRRDAVPAARNLVRLWRAHRSARS